MFRGKLLAAFGIAAIAAIPAQAATTANGVMLNGVMLNGVMLNGVMLNGVMLNGITLNGAQLHNTSDAVAADAAFRAVRLALPDGTELTFR